MIKIENSLEQPSGTGPMTDPEKIEALKKSLKKRFKNFSKEPGHDAYVADRIRHALEETPDDFIEEGIKDNIH